MTTIRTGVKGKISIGSTTAAATQLEFEGDSYTLINGYDSIPEFGDSAEAVTFDDLALGRRLKGKGVRDAGGGVLSMRNLPSDAGQLALLAAEADDSGESYNFKVEHADGEIRYFRALVMSFREGEQTAGSVFMVEAELAINSAILRVAAA